MGKACLILAAMMITLALYPKSQVSGASLENPMVKDSPTELDLDRKMMGPDGDRDNEEYNDYDFLHQPHYGAGYPRDFRAMQRRERLMKRLRRHTMGNRPAYFEE